MSFLFLFSCSVDSEIVSTEFDQKVEQRAVACDGNANSGYVQFSNCMPLAAGCCCEVTIFVNSLNGPVELANGTDLRIRLNGIDDSSASYGSLVCFTTDQLNFINGDPNEIDSDPQGFIIEFEHPNTNGIGCIPVAPGVVGC